MSGQVKEIIYATHCDDTATNMERHKRRCRNLGNDVKWMDNSNYSVQRVIFDA